MREANEKHTYGAAPTLPYKFAFLSIMITFEEYFNLIGLAKRLAKNISNIIRLSKHLDRYGSTNRHGLVHTVGSTISWLVW